MKISIFGEVSSYSQCVGGVAAALQIPLEAAPATYCCAQFVVSRERLQAVSQEVEDAIGPNARGISISRSLHRQAVNDAFVCAAIVAHPLGQLDHE